MALQLESYSGYVKLSQPDLPSILTDFSTQQNYSTFCAKSRYLQVAQWFKIDFEKRPMKPDKEMEK